MLHKGCHLSAVRPEVYLDIFAFLQRTGVFLLLCWVASSVCGVSLKQKGLFFLKYLLNKYIFFFYSAKQNGMWVKERLFPQHTCSCFMDRRTVFGAQKSYCCCREVPAWCLISSNLNFSRGGGGLELCFSGSACTAAVVWAFCLCQGIRTSGGKGCWDD